MIQIPKRNVQAVTMVIDVGQERRYIEVVPQIKNINQYDEKFRPVVKYHEKVEGQDGSKNVKQKTADVEEEEGPGLEKEANPEKWDGDIKSDPGEEGSCRSTPQQQGSWRG